MTCAKGPSLGTNFTLACPYTIIAHYAELEWADRHGVPLQFVRVSVGMEEQGALLEMVKTAVREAEEKQGMYAPGSVPGAMWKGQKLGVGEVKGTSADWD